MSSLRERSVLGSHRRSIACAWVLCLLTLVAGCGRAAAERAAFKRVRDAGGTIEFKGYGPKILFRDTKVTDDDLVCLEGLPRVGLLDLHNTEISDAGIDHILKIGRLDNITLSRTKITKEGMDRLKQHFPDLVFTPH